MNKLILDLEKEARTALKRMNELAYTRRKERRDFNEAEATEFENLEADFDLLTNQMLQARALEYGEGASDDGTPHPLAGYRQPGPVDGNGWGHRGFDTRAAELFPTGKPKDSRVGRAVLDFIRGKENRDLTSSGGTALLQNPRVLQEVFHSLEANNPLKALGAQILNVQNYSQWAVPTTPPSTVWFEEGDTITPDSAMVIGSKKIEFANCVALVKISKLLMQDNAVSSAQVVQEEILRAIRRESLRVVFHGDDTLKEPDGLDNISGVGNTSGATFNDYSPIIEAYSAVMAEDAPLEMIGMVGGVNLWERMTKWQDQQDNPLIMPPAFSGSKGFHYSSVISENFGTTPHLTRAYVGDFSQLRIGYSGPFTLELAERYAEAMNTAVLVWFRLDVQAMRPACFCRIENIPLV